MIYKRIDDNKRKTFFIVFFFFIFVSLLIYLFYYLFNLGAVTLIVALIFVLIFSLYNYFHGDSVVLKLSKAVPAKREENKILFDVVEELSMGYGLPTPKIYVLPDDSINAFSTGRDPQHASVAVTRGALTKLSRTELEGVIGHELSHIKNYDIRLMTIISVLVGLVIIMADIAHNAIFYGGLRKDDDAGNLYFLLLIIGLLLIVFAPLLARIIQYSISRKREYLADADSALLTHNPQGLIGALKKIKEEDLPSKTASAGTAHMYFANPLKSNKFRNLFMTHPPIDKRIEALSHL